MIGHKININLMLFSLQQSEKPQDIARRKEFVQILDILQNPPPVITAEERLKLEKDENKKDSKKKRDNSKDKGDKKREKTNDSATSSKDSSSRMKEKKKVRITTMNIQLVIIST